MNITKKVIRPVTCALGLALLSTAFSTNVLAQNYRMKVKKVRVESASGDVILQVKPGNKEKNFSGKARVMLIGTDPGTNRAMATILTAVSLQAEITVDVANPPSYVDIQVISSTSLVAP